jgi:hypothetical protein
MALKVLDNGYVEIKTQKDALAALQAFRDLKSEIDQVKEESGLNELEKDAMAYKAAVQNFMISKELDQLQGDGFHGTLVKGHGSSRWITDEGDLTGDEADHAMSLRVIIEEKFGEKVTKPKSKARRLWLKITKRIADTDAIEEAVNDGELTVDEIAPAFVEKDRAPYLRIFSD